MNVVLKGTAVPCRMIDIDLSTLEAETRCPVCLGMSLHAYLSLSYWAHIQHCTLRCLQALGALGCMWLQQCCTKLALQVW